MCVYVCTILFYTFYIFCLSMLFYYCQRMEGTQLKLTGFVFTIVLSIIFMKSQQNVLFSIVFLFFSTISSFFSFWRRYHSLVN